MKIKNREIIQVIDTLNELVDLKMPVELTYQTINTVTELYSKYRIYYSSLERIKNNYKEGTDEFREEVDKLLEVDTEVFIAPFKKSALIESGIELTPSQLIGLRPVIQEVDDG